jgi:hypothetical protein
MSFKRNWLGLALVFAGSVGVSTAACGGTAEDPNAVDPYGGAGGGGNVGGFGGSTVGGANGAGGINVGANTGQGGSSGSGTNCGGDRYKAEKSQLDIYVMFDDSGSMVPWWLQVTDAFAQFLNDPASAGIGVGIQYFGRNCDPAFYATPRVPIAPLPGNVMPIQQSYPIIPIESTPTQPALQGAIMHARDWQNSHPDHKVVVLLTTDGEPTECDSTVAGVSQVAAEGLSGSPSIPTYVLGMGLSLTNLHEIARAGGTGQAFIVDPNSQQALTQAMNAIRGAALPCDYVLPNGGNVDPSKVNIDFTPPGAPPQRLPNVGDASRCSGSGGWYYDNPQAPTRAIVCPESCSSFNVQTGSQVDVILGCDTIVF